MQYAFTIPDVQAATTLANISSDYSAGNMITA